MVNTNNQVAVNFYTSLGFETREVLHNQKMGDGNYYDEFYMVKELK
jgi:ribosomal protein S18 acetylase RimI-like enzyme